MILHKFAIVWMNMVAPPICKRSRRKLFAQQVARPNVRWSCPHLRIPFIKHPADAGNHLLGSMLGRRSTAIACSQITHIDKSADDPRQFPFRTKDGNGRANQLNRSSVPESILQFRVMDRLAGACRNMHRKAFRLGGFPSQERKIFRYGRRSLPIFEMGLRAGRQKHFCGRISGHFPAFSVMRDPNRDGENIKQTGPPLRRK